MEIPVNQKIYHITHIKNIPSILSCNGLYSDARRLTEIEDLKEIGIREIKRRRLKEIEVSCNRSTKVGEYVPFYFCPRSIMLYLMYRGNHPDLVYRDGQDKIVHFEADLRKTISWAKGKGIPWAFSDRNGGARYARFWNNEAYLNQIDWNAVESRDFREPVVKENKQAEFLVYDEFPLHLIERFGTMTESVAGELKRIFAGTEYQSRIAVIPAWYY